MAGALPGIVAAAKSGVRPSTVFASTLAPFSSSSFTFAASPAAQCSAVAAREFFAFTSAPASTSACMIGTVPLAAACIKGDDPDPSAAFARVLSAASSVFSSARS